MPPANNIGLLATTMVTSTIGVQTPTYSYGDNDEDDICPKHFTDIHRCKLEDTFSRKQKPDDIQLQVIAMECNLLYKDVRDWFRKRRLKWIEDLVRNDNTLNSSSQKQSSDSNNNNNAPILSKKLQQNSLKHNNTMEYKNSKNIIASNSTRSQQDVATT